MGEQSSITHGDSNANFIQILLPVKAQDSLWLLTLAKTLY